MSDIDDHKARAGKAPTLSELQALYELRVREIHHYNTIIWAFPVGFAGLLSAQHRFLGMGSLALLIAGLFNLALCYVFCRHTQNFDAIKLATSRIEKRLKHRMPIGCFPDFKNSCCPARCVMNWAVWSLAMSSLIVALLGFLATMSPTLSSIAGWLKSNFIIKS